MVRSERVFERHVSLAGRTPSDVGRIDGFADLARDGASLCGTKDTDKVFSLSLSVSAWCFDLTSDPPDS